MILLDNLPVGNAYGAASYLSLKKSLQLLEITVRVPKKTAAIADHRNIEAPASSLLIFNSCRSHTRGNHECQYRYYSTRNFLTFANTTDIAYRKNLEAPGNFSPICNSSCVCKRQKITSRVHTGPSRGLARLQACASLWKYDTCMKLLHITQHHEMLSCQETARKKLSLWTRHSWCLNPDLALCWLLGIFGLVTWLIPLSSFSHRLRAMLQWRGGSIKKWSKARNALFRTGEL